MANKTKFGFGLEQDIQSALDAESLNAYDILCLNSGEDAKMGWIDKDGNPVIVNGKKYVNLVDELPVENGKDDVIYIFNNEAYIWDGEKCIPLFKSADLTKVEADIDNLETAMATKVTAEEVDVQIQAKIEEMYALEIVEF